MFSHRCKPERLVWYPWLGAVMILLLREEQDVDPGGSEGKIHRSAHYEYGNVRAPM
ncbi:MAG TPA: hypothetical protein VGG04_04440 [Candidatus Sulfotelmatobacter sp.]|jgi:hypothetical protein